MMKTLQTHAQKDAAIKRFERFYLGGAVICAGLAILFYFGVIPFGDGTFAAMWLGAGAGAVSQRHYGYTCGSKNESAFG